MTPEQIQEKVTNLKTQDGMDMHEVMAYLHENVALVDILAWIHWLDRVGNPEHRKAQEP